jgi:hypothetical protein
MMDNNIKINVDDFVSKVFTINNVNIDSIINNKDVINIDNDKLIQPIK